MGAWNFDNDFARSAITFDADNSSSSHSDNCKSNFLILDESPTHSINGSVGSPRKKLVLVLLQQTQICA